MAKSSPSSPFYWNDYFRDTRVLSLPTRAIWMDMLCRAHESVTRGKVTLTIEEWAQWCACGQPQIVQAEVELRRHGVGDVSKKVTRRNVKSNATSNVYVTVINRRMVREEEFKKNNAMRQDRFREKQGSNAGVTATVTPHVTRTQRGSNSAPSSSSSSSDKTKILVAPKKGDKSVEKSGTGVKHISSLVKEFFQDKIPLEEEPAT